MIATLFGLFGFVSMVFLAGLCCSRYAIDVATLLLKRHRMRLQAHRDGLSDYREAYRRSLEFQRLQGRILGE